MENKNSIAGNENNSHADVSFSDILSGIREAKNQLEDSNLQPESENRVPDEVQPDIPEDAGLPVTEETPASVVPEENADSGDNGGEVLSAAEELVPESSSANDLSVESAPDKPLEESVLPEPDIANLPSASLSPASEDSAEEEISEAAEAAPATEEMPSAADEQVLLEKLREELQKNEESSQEISSPAEAVAEEPAGTDMVTPPEKTAPEEPIEPEEPSVAETPAESADDSHSHGPSADEEDNPEIPEDELPKKKSPAGKILLAVLFLLILLCSVAVIVFQVAVPERERLEVTAGVHFLLGNYQSSETAYLKLLTGNEAEDEKTVDNLLRTYTAWSAAAARSKKMDIGAVYASEKLLNYVPDNDVYKYYYSKNLYHAGRYEDAKNVCAVILENDPLNRDYNDLMLEISLAGGFRREEVQTYFRMYEITGDEKYRLTANYMIPSAPAFSNLGGDSDFYIKLTIKAPENCKVVFTVDGSKPDSSVALTDTPNITSRTHVYQDGLDFSYYANGKSMILRAVSVTEDGVESYETIGIYNFNLEYCPVETITLNRSEITLTEGDVFSLRPDIQPSGATNKNIVWRSTNEKFVTVDDNGLVTAVNFTDSEDPDVRCQTAVTVDVIGKAMSENVTVVCKVTVVPEKIKPTNDTFLAKNLLDFDLTKPLEVHDDTVGWLYMEYHYKVPFLPNDPIVRAPSDTPDFYRSHNIYKAQNPDGTLSVPFGTNMQTLGKNTVIEGNVFSLSEYTSDESGKQTAAEKESRRLQELAKYPMGGGYMFSALAGLNREPEWYLDADNHFVYLGTGHATYVCQMFSWYKAEGFDNYDVVDFSSDEDFVSYAKSLQERNQLFNLIRYENFAPSDCIVTLVGYKNGVPDTVVHAKVVKYLAFESGYYATAPSVSESTHYVPWNIDSGTVEGNVEDNEPVSDGENQTPAESD